MCSIILAEDTVRKIGWSWNIVQEQKTGPLMVTWEAYSKILPRKSESKWCLKKFKSNGARIIRKILDFSELLKV
jgi:hypothetical protein